MILKTVLLFIHDFIVLKGKKYKLFFLTVFLLLDFTTSEAQESDKILIASKGTTFFKIFTRTIPSTTEKFAAEELAKYLNKITDADFPVYSDDENSDSKIFIYIDSTLQNETYEISVSPQKINISGGSNRAVLYAAYNFLERLGCKWIAPTFTFYDGSAECVPRKKELFFEKSFAIHRQARFFYRKLDVEEGLSHNIDNLKKMVDWMSKVGFNTLMIPANYGGAGRVVWDKWAQELTPELKKRGLLIEVGGHGYQNFLNAAMEDSTLLELHPDWFGKDSDCRPSSKEYIVFNTANKEAVDYLTDNVLKYVNKHPEIDILDFWPPDGAHWSDCTASDTLGLAVDRQARLVNHVASTIRNAGSNVILEMIAYQPVLLPPQRVRLKEDVLVDFCPINQSFEKQINDSGALNNKNYVQALKEWRQYFPGNVGLYSYFRKYAWHSLPNVIPHYMQKDMQWYADVPVQGISSYAEPGDWFSYELNYYVLGHLAWDPTINIDSLLSQYCLTRFKGFAKSAKKIYSLLEEIVPVYCSIPYTVLKSEEQIFNAKKIISTELVSLEKIAKENIDKSIAGNLSRLVLMLRYVFYDLDIQQLMAKNANKKMIQSKQEELLSFLRKNEKKGVFIVPSKNDLKWVKNHYRVYK